MNPEADVGSPLVPGAADLVVPALFLLGSAAVVVALVAFVVGKALTEPLETRGRVPAQERSAEARLAEAVALHEQGRITADELGQARQRILDGL